MKNRDGPGDDAMIVKAHRYPGTEMILHFCMIVQQTA